MVNLIEEICKTREKASEIATKSLSNIDNISEVELCDRILANVLSHKELFPKGWYDPPVGGVSVLFDKAPFERLLYDSLRNPKYSPSTNYFFEKETVGSVYFSPVNKITKTLADIGFTIYRGENEDIKQHLKKSYDVIRKIAEYTEVGMKFSDLCIFASSLFSANNFRPSRRVILSSDQNQSLNLGHSVPGVSVDDLILGDSFEEIKENIRTHRVHFIDTENFEIPETYAFTVESRLEDINNASMPSVSWHFMVCFDKGKKTILDNFTKIFKAARMDYMNVQ